MTIHKPRHLLRAAFLGLSLASLPACGAVYISPDVAPKDNGSVQVVALTPDIAQQANASHYQSKQIPSAFFQNAGAGGALRGAGAPPEPALDPEQKPAALELRPPPTAPQTPYGIGIGDVVLLATKSARDSVAELSGLLAAQNSRQGYTVQDDGAIAVPDVGRIEIAGLTLQQAEAAVFQALVEQQINPTFSLEIAEFNSKRVSVGGAVANPTVAPISLTGLTLDEALSAAGGVATPDRDFALLRIYRAGALYQIPLKDYLRVADLQKTRLVAGDSIFVDTEFQLERAQSYFEQQIALSTLRRNARTQALAELETEITLRRAALSETRSNFEAQVALDATPRDYVYLTGEVNAPGRFDLPFGRSATLADALYEEGGFNTETGNPSQIYVLRGSAKGDRVTAYQLDARNVVNLVVATRFEMRPNDIVFIAEQPVTRWSRTLQQIVPSLLSSGISAAAR